MVDDETNLFDFAVDLSAPRTSNLDSVKAEEDVEAVVESSGKIAEDLSIAEYG